MSFHDDRRVRVMCDKKVANRARRLNTGKRAQALECLLVKGLRSGVAISTISRPGKIDAHDQHAFGPEAGLDGLNGEKTADQESRATEQHDGQGELDDDKPSPRAPAAGPI